MRRQWTQSVGPKKAEGHKKWRGVIRRLASLFVIGSCDDVEEARHRYLKQKYDLSVCHAARSNVTPENRLKCSSVVSEIGSRAAKFVFEIHGAPGLSRVEVTGRSLIVRIDKAKVQHEESLRAMLKSRFYQYVRDIPSYA